MTVAHLPRMMVLSTLVLTFLSLASTLASLRLKLLASSRSMVRLRNARSCLTLTPRNLVASVLSKWSLLSRLMLPRKVFRVKLSKAAP
jgi:hypothetical protein